MSNFKEYPAPESGNEVNGPLSDGRIYFRRNNVIFKYSPSELQLLTDSRTYVYNAPIADYVRIGGIYFTGDSKGKNNCGSSNSDGRIMLDTQRSCMFYNNLMNYSAVTACAVIQNSNSITEKKILDLGTHDGVLAVLSKYLGAAEIDMIDIKDRTNLIQKTLDLNGMDKAQFNFYLGSIDELIGKYNKQPEILVANIGPQYPDYRDIFRICKNLDSVRFAIIGGYELDIDKNSIKEDKAILKSLGFKNYLEYYVKGYNPEGRKFRTVAFTVER